MRSERVHSASVLLLMLLSSVHCGCPAFDDLKLAPQRCDHAGVAAPPSRADDSGSSSPAVEHEFTVALSSVDFGDSAEARGSPGWRAIGFDLDGRCTGQGQATSCAPPAWLSAKERQWLAGRDDDGLAGRDNAFGALTDEGYKLTMISMGISISEFVTSEMRAGRSSLAIRVSHYNGLSNDDQVKVEVIGVRVAPGSEPGWKGFDVWQPVLEFVLPDSGSSGNPYQAKYVAHEAYVTDHVLVARFGELLGPVRIVVKGVLLSARIVDGDGGGPWSLEDGMFGGVARIHALLEMAEYFPDIKLCRGTELYEKGFKPLACKYADIDADIADAPSDPALPCDGASAGFSFSAQSAHLGNDIDRSELPDNCKEEHAAGLFAKDDTCDSLSPDH